MTEPKPDLEDQLLVHFGVKGMKWGQKLAAKPITTNMAALNKIQKDTSGTVKGKGTPVWKTLFGAGNKATLDYIMAHIGSLPLRAPSKSKGVGAKATVNALKKVGTRPVQTPVPRKKPAIKVAPKPVVRRT